MASDLLEIGGTLIAFAVAAAVIYIDCYQAFSKTVRSIPSQFYTSVGIYLLAAACGGLAVLAFDFTRPNGNDWVDKLLTLDIQPPLLRAFYVGGAVLVLIRSKVTQLQSVDVGGEFFYGRVREAVLRRTQLDWIVWRDDFANRNLDRTLDFPDFATTLIARIRDGARFSDADYQAYLTTQLEELKRQAPSEPFGKTSPAWRLYHRTVMRLALDNSGVAALRGYVA